ncbi:TauD/TfdA family dioxygenase [Roseiarcaceae bacterium H3SJ34-1]|uniref:TauD/TfdA dioxygenase family protein n=1 Tax=Terripilifer ovatus TaxID=3032367 RepID=UPI003AB95744|nr:TauD/TfdA family dioxygenase [Roseiarcaceae bacterium H3SJ34-1]
MNLVVNSISDAGAAEVVGFDCRSIHDTADQRWGDIQAAFAANPILCFRDQSLSAKEQARFARLWGALEAQDRSAYCNPDDKDVLILSNERNADGSQVGIVDAGDFWHSDSSHMKNPCRMTMLHALKNPAQGGDTHYMNLTQVYEALPLTLKRAINGRNGIHHISKTLNPRVSVSEERQGAKEYYIKHAKQTPPALQPLVRTHPDTGRSALYASPRFTIGIDGMADTEAQNLLDELFEFMFSSQSWMYDHKWRDGDFVIWDNACLNHMAGGGYQYPDTRRMHRTTVAGGPAFFRTDRAPAAEETGNTNS